MNIEREEYELGGHKIVLRSLKEGEGDILLEYIKDVNNESKYLIREPDEINYTLKDEEAFIRSHLKSSRQLLIGAWVDDEFAGTCSFEGKTGTRRNYHRAGMAIALREKFTNFGLGRLMMKRLMEEAEKVGFEQIELNVVSANKRAIHLYEKFGFIECGRIPNACKYDDGTYNDIVIMVNIF